MERPSSPHDSKVLKYKEKACRAGLVAAGFLLVWSGVAFAGKKVVIMDFDGPNGRSVRAAVVRSLRGNHDIVPRRTLLSEARKMGFSTQCDANIISGVASVVGAEAVVCGSVVRSRLLALRVYNGGDGKIIRSVKVRLGRGGINTRALQTINSRVEPALAKTWNWDAVEVNSKKQAPRKIAATAPEPDLPETSAAATLPEANHAWEGSDDENPLMNRAPKASTRAAPTVRARPEAPRRADGEHALRLSVGPAMLLRRNYGVYYASPQSTSPGWKTTPVAGIAFAAELYPATWFTKGWATHVGIGLDYSRFFGLGWRNSGDTEERAATHQVFSVDLRGRYGLKLGARTLSFLVRGGFRHLGFAMNDSSESRAVIPDVSFNSLDLGATAAFTLLPKWLTVSAHFDYLPVFGRGEIVTFEEFGPGSGSGMRFGGGLRGSITAGFGWQLEVDYARYAVRFAGHPEARRAFEQATVARDRYLSGNIYLTYTN